jgi:hypothetical protein
MIAIKKISVLVIFAIVINSCSSKLSKKEFENIDKNGIETVGKVTNKNFVTKTINNYETTEYIIEFEFQYKEKTISAKYSLGKNEDAWNKVQNGDVYKVKYLDLGEETAKNVILYTDTPKE